MRHNYVTRLAAILCLLCLCASAQQLDLKTLLKGVETRYNKAKTLEVQFNEAYTGAGGPRQSESGKLTLRKPGRMRWDYSAPAGKLFVSDGKQVYLYNPELKRVERMPLKESEDMRAPLAFLLGKLDFKKEFKSLGFCLRASSASSTASRNRPDWIYKSDSSSEMKVALGSALSAAR